MLRILAGTLVLPPKRIEICDASAYTIDRCMYYIIKYNYHMKLIALSKKLRK